MPVTAKWLTQFFGDLSPFQIFVSLVALLTGIYTFYKSFLERAKISMYPGDAVRFIVSKDGPFSNFHLMCNLINKSTKVGTVHRLEVRVWASEYHLRLYMESVLQVFAWWTGGSKGK